MRATAFRWILRGEPFQPGTGPPDPEFPEILAHLAGQRGVTSQDDLEKFLRPRLKDLSDPFLIPDMHPAVKRVLAAADRGETVCVYGDYDVDGVSSIALMQKILHAYGLNPRSFIPRRGTEGYGLSIAAIDRCLAEGQRPDLLITVDCGTVSVEEVAYLRTLGTEVLIVDHHEPAPGARPDCVALVNPKCGSDFTYLCAAGVVFKLGHALLKTRKVDLDLKELLDLVAVATVADIVPLVGENRLLVRHGLRHLPSTLNPGLRALQEITGISGSPTSMDVGFRIGPRINAAGRMDCPEDALATLTTDCRRTAGELAKKLDDYNRERQAHEGIIRKEAVSQLSEGFDPDSRSGHRHRLPQLAPRSRRNRRLPPHEAILQTDLRDRDRCRGRGKGLGTQYRRHFPG